jgi:aryl-alcohol dehydrogenase-like predicted oxidoreductase
MPGENGRGLSRKHVLASIDASLSGSVYVDPYQIHRWDHWTPIEETMEALHDDEGREGSLHRGEQHVRLAVQEGQRVAKTPFVSMQTTTTSCTARRSGR